jgi:type III pantothenate kinase
VLLVIDAGNTQTVVGLYDIDSESSTTVQASDGLIDHWRIATEAERTSDEMAAMLQSFLNQRGHSLTDDVTGMAVSSGVPRVTANLRDLADRYLGLVPVVIEPGIRTGISIL